MATAEAAKSRGMPRLQRNVQNLSNSTAQMHTSLAEGPRYEPEGAKEVPGMPIARAEEKGLFELPDIPTTLRELRTLVAEASPTDAIFRTNHASNRLPIAGRLPRDRDEIVQAVDAALAGDIALRPEWMRGL